jgi:hypothetical protein
LHARLDGRDFLRQYCDESPMPAFSTEHVSTGIPVVTIKIPQMESVHQNRIGGKTSIIAASIGERFHPLFDARPTNDRNTLIHIQKIQLRHT